MATSSWSSFLTKVWRLSLQMVPYTFMNDLWPNMMKIYMREACIWLLSGYDHWHCHYHNHRHFILPPKWISQKWWYLFFLLPISSFFSHHLAPPISLWQWILFCETQAWYLGELAISQAGPQLDWVREGPRLSSECILQGESRRANLKNQQRRLMVKHLHQTAAANICFKLRRRHR